MVIGYLFKERCEAILNQVLYILFIFEGKMASDAHNTRLRGVKKELQDLKKDVSSSLAEFKASIDIKFDVISNGLNAIEENFQRHVNDIIAKELNEKVMSVKDSIIEALKE